MTTTLMVLWLYFAQPWSWGPLPMTAGWASVAVLDESACAEALTRAGSPAACLPAGSEDPWPLAQILRK